MGKNLKDVEVEIYLGTWCGDSRREVPRFVKMLDELQLNRKQLKFIALYDFTDGKYKQGPKGEEKGKNIHRIPTFIFSRNGKEIGRIVESPINDLETDLAQIALGFPSSPNYRGASYLINLLKTVPAKEILNDWQHLSAVYRLAKHPSELNTLGYVFLSSDRNEEALAVFYYNTRYFRCDPNVYDSYAEALAKLERTEEAIENYKKVLLLDRSNKNASEQLQKLQEN